MSFCVLWITEHFSWNSLWHTLFITQIPQFRSQLWEVFVWLVAGPTFSLGFCNALWKLPEQNQGASSSVLSFLVGCLVLLLRSCDQSIRHRQLKRNRYLFGSWFGSTESGLVWGILTKYIRGMGMLTSEYTGRIKKTRMVPCTRYSRYLPPVGYFFQLGSTSQIPTTSSLLAGSLLGTKQSTFI